MKVFSQILGLAAFVVPVVVGKPLQKCSTNASLPCQCPKGTQYAESMTLTVIGAPAIDVATLVTDFQKTAWLGVVPYRFEGPNFTPGSKRFTLFPTPIGVYDISEILTDYKVEKDGSFFKRFEMDSSIVPVPYQGRKGAFGGYWVTIEGKNVFKSETYVRWSIFACETGHPRDFSAFHRSALSNATKILTDQGKAKGISNGPWSVQSWVQDP